MQDRYDVIVVGGGPAGAMAAHVLGRAGCRTLVLERRPLPRYKPCGGGIPANVFAALPPVCSQAIERQVTRARFVRGRREVAHELPDGAIAMVMRDRFDSLLLAQARAVVHDGEGAVGLEAGPAGVTVHTGRGRYEASYVLGADGAFSLVARAAGLRRRHAAGLALEAELPVSAGLLEQWAGAALFDLGAVRNGYAWVFPKGDHLSVGIGTFRAGGRALRQRLAEATTRLGLPAERLRPRGHALPVYRRRERLQVGRVLLLGDAAGLMDPLSGEGIRHALRSGRLAAEAILGGNVAGYSRWVHEEIGRDLGLGLRLAQLFYALPGLSFRLGAPDPTVVRGLMHMLSGQTTYRALLARVPGHYVRKLMAALKSRLATGE